MVNNGHLGYFHMLGVMNKAAVHICVQVFMWIYIFSFGYILKRRIVGSYDNLCLTEKLPFFQKGLHHFTFPSYAAGGHGKW